MALFTLGQGELAALLHVVCLICTRLPTPGGSDGMNMSWVQHEVCSSPPGRRICRNARRDKGHRAHPGAQCSMRCVSQPQGLVTLQGCAPRAGRGVWCQVTTSPASRHTSLGSLFTGQDVRFGCYHIPARALLLGCSGTLITKEAAALVLLCN